MEKVLRQIDENQLAINAKCKPQKYEEHYKIILTQSSNALDGNPLSASEVKVILEDGIVPGTYPIRYIWETASHANAYGYMLEQASKSFIDISVICKAHKLLYEWTDKKAGMYRAGSMLIVGSAHSPPPPDDIELEMSKLEVWMGIERGFLHPVQFAAELHRRLTTIMPFSGANGKVARLAMNLALAQSGYEFAIIRPEKKAEYLQALEQSWKNKKTFYRFIADCVMQEQRTTMHLLHISISKKPTEIEK